MVLDKEGLLEELKLNTEEVQLKNGVALVSEIGAMDWMEIVTSEKYKVDGVTDESKIQPILVARAVLCPDGSRMFTDEEAMLVAQSSKKPFKKIVEAVMRMNGLGGYETKN